MRKETREYNYDWMLWRTYTAASRAKKGSDSEYRTLLKYIPGFRGALEPVLAHDEVGEAFLEMTAKYLENIILAHDRGKKTAISTFCFSPAILYAMDVVPITLELLTVMGTFLWKRGTAEYLEYCCEAGFTETSCSSQRGSLGAYLAGLGEEIDFVLCDSPGVCDTNANAFAFTSVYLDKPFYQLNMPPDLTGERSRRYHREDFRNMIRFIEEQTGKKLDIDRLREILLEIDRQDRLCDEIEDLQRIIPNPAPVEYPLFLYASRFLFAGMEEGTNILNLMRNAVEKNARERLSGLKSGDEKVRALFCYIDHYTTDLRMWDMLNDNGVTHLGGILSRHWDAGSIIAKEKGDGEEGYVIDTTDMDAMIDSIASINSRLPMIKSIRGPYDKPHMWLEDNLALAKMYNADMIVYSGTPGCRNTWGMVKLFARDTEREGYPTYIMYSDAFDDRVESWETTRDRFEEFLKVRRLV